MHQVLSSASEGLPVGDKNNRCSVIVRIVTVDLKESSDRSDPTEIHLPKGRRPPKLVCDDSPTPKSRGSSRNWHFKGDGPGFRLSLVPEVPIALKDCFIFRSTPWGPRRSGESDTRQTNRSPQDPSETREPRRAHLTGGERAGSSDSLTSLPDSLT